VVQPRNHEQVDAALLHVPRPVITLSRGRGFLPFISRIDALLLLFSVHPRRVFRIGALFLLFPGHPRKVSRIAALLLLFSGVPLSK
jgi:hypothetical protein